MNERFIWIHSWCDYTEKKDLPRVLLIGDSITHQYNEFVRKQLRGICYVDYVSSAYGIDSPVYDSLVREFVKDAEYDVIHFNYGLHGFHQNKEEYKASMDKMIDFLRGYGKLIVATSTLVKTDGNKEIDMKYHPAILERNEAVRELSEKYHFTVNDLYAASCSVSDSDRWPDGWHYNAKTSERFAEQVTECIKKEIGV